MDRNDKSEETRHQHKGKFTQGLLDNEAVLKALNIKAGQTILDAGCGNGYMSKLFSRAVTRTGKVYALDPDSYFIKLLENEIRGTNIETLTGDITRPTPLEESSIDLVYISTVIHGFSKNEFQGFLHEINRLLKTNGNLAIVEIEKKETPFGPPMELRFSPEELKTLIPMVPVNTIQVGDHFYMQIFQDKENQDE